MMYTPTPPDSHTDRTRLFRSPETVPDHLLDGRTVFEVAVRFDARNRRVEPLESWVVEHHLVWITPGEAHADGSVTARGTVPPALYTGRSTGAVVRLRAERPGGAVAS